jgi:hypothetical protein
MSDITYDDVANVCKMLKKEKKKINVPNVRDILKRGSNTTIQKQILNWRNKIKPEYNVCSKCHGSGKTKKRSIQIESPDTNRMRILMKKHQLTMYSLAKLIGISQGTVSGWFHFGTNKNGTIKQIYFDLLKLKGIE